MKKEFLALRGEGAEECYQPLGAVSLLTPLERSAALRMCCFLPKL